MRPTRCRATHGFTLVELLVVIAIIGVLVAMFLPSLAGAKRLTRITLCASQMRQQAMMLGMYASDCKDFVPSSNTPHRTGALFTHGLAMLTMGTPSPLCPLGSSPTAYPTGFGWFFWMGYARPINPRTKLGIFQCPDSTTLSAPWVGGGGNYGYAEYMEKWYPAAGVLTTGFAAQNQAVTSIPGLGANWDCVTTASTDYLFRGWYRAGTNLQMRKNVNWRPDDPIAVDLEHYEPNLAPPPKYLDSHGDGVNALFHDGHVRLTGKDINSTKPHIYYAMLYGATLSQAQNFGANASSGYCYTGGAFSDTATAALWNYYQTSP